MGARFAAAVQKSAKLDAAQSALQRHDHKAAAACRVNPAEVVEHSPVDVVKIWCTPGPVPGPRGKSREAVLPLLVPVQVLKALFQVSVPIASGIAIDGSTGQGNVFNLKKFESGEEQ